MEIKTVLQQPSQTARQFIVNPKGKSDEISYPTQERRDQVVHLP
jgi:hypothetical protein